MFTHVSESRINATEGYRFSDAEYPVAGTVFEDMETPGEIYRWLRGEYGRCTGRVYQDTASGVVQCGWMFQKRDRYEDTGAPYLLETWVTFMDRRETVEIREPHDFGARP